MTWVTWADVVTAEGAVREEVRLNADQTKGRHPRTVYISPKLQKELRAYIAAIPEREPSAALFYTQKHPRRGFTPTNAVLDQVVVAGRGSARSIFSDVVMGANQAKRSGQTAVAKIANIRN